MATLEQIIKREPNPFDSLTCVSGNFWREDHKKAVNSIHQNDLNFMSEIVSLVAKDQKSRSILLQGDQGCGKSYLLGRLKEKLNPQAFFVYIEPIRQSDYIWRNTLRAIIDSLMNIPAGEEDSQLQLWLKGLLSSFSDKNFLDVLLGEKRKFINNFCATYPSGVYQAKQFFSVLYELTNPENQYIACEWLRGDILDDSDLKILGVKFNLDDEEKARNIIKNFGRIAQGTKPLVLCFDQVELGPKLLDGSIDMSHVFHLNTTIHNDFLLNYCVIISVVKQIFISNKKNIPHSDFARFERKIDLQKIKLEQALSLWKLRLSPLHHQAKPKPESEILPLTEEQLKTEYPSSKMILRDCLNLGEKLIDQYKNNNFDNNNNNTDDQNKPQDNILANFKLKWQHEFTKQEKNITYIKHFASNDLKMMLKHTLECLECETIKDRFLNSKTYAPYSFISNIKEQKIGLFWNEESSLQSFNWAMKACLQIDPKESDFLVLIRSEKLGTPQNMGYKNYKKIFKDHPSNSHIIPDLESVLYLRTYQVLANAAESGELVLKGQDINLEKYQELVKKSEVLNDCILLQKLGIVKEKIRDIQPTIIDPKKVKETVINIIKSHHMMSKLNIINNVINLLPKASESVINQVIQELCEEKIIKVFNPEGKPEEQSICLLPSAIMF